jgi:hypothetical protein
MCRCLIACNKSEQHKGNYPAIVFEVIIHFKCLVHHLRNAKDDSFDWAGCLTPVE